MRHGVLRDLAGNRLAVEIPTGRRERMRGLLGRTGLPDGNAMLLEGARSVHTFRMRFPITAVFLDAELRVAAVRRMAPRRLAFPRRGIRHVLECTDGFRACLGHQLHWEERAEAAAGGKGRRRA